MTRDDIVTFRQRYGFDQQELADAIDVRCSYLLRIERGLLPISAALERQISLFIAFVETREKEGRL